MEVRKEILQSLRAPSQVIKAMLKQIDEKRNHPLQYNPYQISESRKIIPDFTTPQRIQNEKDFFLKDVLSLSQEHQELQGYTVNLS